MEPIRWDINLKPDTELRHFTGSGIGAEAVQLKLEPMEPEQEAPGLGAGAEMRYPGVGTGARLSKNLSVSNPG